MQPVERWTALKCVDFFVPGQGRADINIYGGVLMRI